MSRQSGSQLVSKQVLKPVMDHMALLHGQPFTISNNALKILQNSIDKELALLIEEAVRVHKEHNSIHQCCNVEWEEKWQKQQNQALNAIDIEIATKNRNMDKFIDEDNTTKTDCQKRLKCHCESVGDSFNPLLIDQRNQRYLETMRGDDSDSEVRICTSFNSLLHK
eukprot:TRINITY_DN777811_c0_g1_i1.p1 TRINITY_DN777811_c0_g1~~TRINITY_DN777811_c0_g1_i1.p1  ORF type:complete len:166 (+),score=20.58 TRINITY_DN777811_c0_g1_i1:157-654(+)